jgi:bifunctional non-homologous end joining protein LigD
MSATELIDLMRRFTEVELATLVDAPPEGSEWVHEIKFDGYRLLAFLANGEVRLRTRNGNDWTPKFPAISASVAKLKAKTAVVDMEAVVLDSAGKSSFQAMQGALGDAGNSNSIQAFAFDLLYLDGKDITGEPVISRKELLEGLLKKSKDSKSLHYSDHVTGHGADMLAKSCAMGLEGVVSKLADSPYRPGRQKSWLKSKCIKRQEFVIIGYTDARTGPRAIGALHLGYNDEGKLKYAGKVGTGFGMKDAKALFDRLKKLETDTPPVPNLPRSVVRTAHWVKPALLCEVSFTEWTDDGHIRHPSFQGLREDKKPQEVVKEKPVRIKSADAVKNSDSSKKSSRRKSETNSEPPKKSNRPKSENDSESSKKSDRQKSDSDRLDVLGVSVSHPDRVIFKNTNITKGDLAEYFAAVAPWILKDIAFHPISLLRCPAGTQGDCFFQRNPGTGLGPDIKPFRWRHKGKSYEYLYIEDEKGLIEVIQMGAIEIHPWGSRFDSIDYPDRMVFDLDPDVNIPFEAVKLAARDLRRRLDAVGLESFLKCSGGKGLHITVPLLAKDNWDAVKAFCAGIAHQMAEEVPTAYVATMTKAKRTGKIFVDFFRNDYTATAIADYGVRARPGGPVALPIEWSELGRLKAANQFTISDVLERIKKKRPNTDRYTKRQRLPK